MMNWTNAAAGKPVAQLAPVMIFFKSYPNFLFVSPGERLIVV
jgi:hypothetical protein